MKCRHCLNIHPPGKVPNFLPRPLFPLRLLVHCVQCEDCLRYFYRVRLVGWLIDSEGPQDEADEDDGDDAA